MKKITQPTATQRSLYILSRTTAVLALLFLITNCGFPLPPEKLHQPSSLVVLHRNGEWSRAFAAPEASWQIVQPALAEISPKLQTAVLA